MVDANKSLVQWSWRAILGLGVLLVAVVFAGVMAGGWVVEQRQGPSHDLSVVSTETITTVRVGDLFPDVDIVAPDGGVVGAVSLCGVDMLVVFVVEGCEPCGNLVDEWRDPASRPRGDVRIVGICSQDHMATQEYAGKAAMPFPLFADPEHVFNETYNVHSYPSVWGVDRDGVVTHIWEGRRIGAGFDDYVDALVRR